MNTLHIAIIGIVAVLFIPLLNVSGLVTSESKIQLLTGKPTYVPGEKIQIIGAFNPNDLIHIDLVNPLDGTKNSTLLQSDNTGHFRTNYVVPYDVVNGTWKILATSGYNHASLDIQVISSNYELKNKNTTYGSDGPVTITPIKSPLKQFKSGIAAKDVKCKEGLQFILKNENGQPACVTVHTFDELITRGWGIIPLGGLPTPNNASPNISISIFYNGTLVSYNDNPINLKQGQNATLMLNVTSDRGNTPVTLYTAPHSGFTKTNGIDFKLSDTAVNTPAKVMLYMSVSKDATPSTYGATVKGNNTNSGSVTYLFFVKVIK